MTPKPYEYLLEMNRGYDQIVRSLKALAKYPLPKPVLIERTRQLWNRHCAAGSAKFIC